MTMRKKSTLDMNEQLQTLTPQYQKVNKGARETAQCGEIKWVKP